MRGARRSGGGRQGNSAGSKPCQITRALAKPHSDCGLVRVDDDRDVAEETGQGRDAAPAHSACGVPWQTATRGIVRFCCRKRKVAPHSAPTLRRVGRRLQDVLVEVQDGEVELDAGRFRPVREAGIGGQRALAEIPPAATAFAEIGDEGEFGAELEQLILVRHVPAVGEDPQWARQRRGGAGKSQSLRHGDGGCSRARRRRPRMSPGAGRLRAAALPPGRPPPGDGRASRRRCRGGAARAGRPGLPRPPRRR